MMVTMLMLTFPMLASPLLHAQSAPSPTGKMVITFTDIRSDMGKVLVAIYNNPGQWTDNPYREYGYDKLEMKNGRLTVEIENLPYDTYAIAILDDENGSKEMEYRLGLPREGWGMSTNPSFLSLKKPGFDDVSFELDAPVVRFEIMLNYINKNKKVD